MAFSSFSSFSSVTKRSAAASNKPVITITTNTFTLNTSLTSPGISINTLAATPSYKRYTSTDGRYSQYVFLSGSSKTFAFTTSSPVEVNLLLVGGGGTGGLGYGQGGSGGQVLTYSGTVTTSDSFNITVANWANAVEEFTDANNNVRRTVAPNGFSTICNSTTFGNLTATGGSGGAYGTTTPNSYLSVNGTDGTLVNNQYPGLLNAKWSYWAGGGGSYGTSSSLPGRGGKGGGGSGHGMGVGTSSYSDTTYSYQDSLWEWPGPNSISSYAPHGRNNTGSGGGASGYYSVTTTSGVTRWYSNNTAGRGASGIVIIAIKNL